jgi:hypothetical protein
MHIRHIASLLAGSIALTATAQTSAPTPATVVVATGTVVPLTLVNPIKHKSTKPGDTVRARVAFPITVGNQIAIPPGTIVEGIFGKLPKGQKTPNVSIHFTRLVYANGYTVSLDGLNTAALALPPVDTYAMLERPALHGPSPDPDPLPEPDPAPAPQTSNPYPSDPYAHGTTTKELVAFTAGPIAFGGLIFALFHFTQPHGDYMLDAAGWQFQMTLQSPLTVDVSSVTAAAAAPTH